MSAAVQEAARLARLGQWPQAAQVLRQHLQNAQPAPSPQNAPAWHMLGMLHLQTGQWAEAAAALEQAVACGAADASTRAMLGIAHSQLGQAEEAIAHFDAAVALAPGQAALWCDRGRALHAAHRMQQALESADRALALNPALPAARLLRGNVLRELGRAHDGLLDLREAARLAPGDATAWHALAEILCVMGHLEESQDCALRGLALAPAHAGLWISLGNAQFELAQPDASMRSYQRANQLDARQARAWIGQARVLEEKDQPRQALDCFEKGRALDPDTLTYTLQHMWLLQRQAEWDKLPPVHAQVLARLDEHATFNAPFAMLAHPDARATDLLRSARACIAVERNKLPRPLPQRPALPALTDGPLRIGYFSCDLRDHAVSYLMAGVFEAHDRQAFRVIGIDASLKDARDTPFRRRVVGAFDEYVTLGRQRTPEQAARRIRELQLDVLIDLMGATGDGHAGVLLRRPAPLQVAWLGFPGTSGMDEIDYLLADRHVAPPGSEGEFGECLARLPDTFQPNDDRRAISPHTPTRASLGLPENGFVFCCHNNTYKILPGVFDIWMRLLRAVPGSVLWLVNDGEHARANLRQQAARRGIDAERLVFAGHCDYPDYLARYRAADLFLDTLPFNAGTTASDALWAGLPVLTQTGHSFAGRMATSLLHAVGLPELVTPSAADYEALALRLATHPQELATLRQRLTQQGPRSPLFNTARFTRHLEQALITLHHRHQQGLPPASFDVPPLP